MTVQDITGMSPWLWGSFGWPDMQAQNLAGLEPGLPWSPSPFSPMDGFFPGDFGGMGFDGMSQQLLWQQEWQQLAETILALFIYYIANQMGGSPGQDLGTMGGPGGFSQSRSVSPASWGGGPSTPSFARPTAAPAHSNTNRSGQFNDPLSVAYSLMGRNASDIKRNGVIADEMTDWTGDDTSCANFVSACLQEAGWISDGEHDDWVKGLSGKLRADPNFSEVNARDLQPGDVLVMNNSGHVVFFAGWTEDGKMKYIGSNNRNADGSQRVSEGTASTSHFTTGFHYNGPQRRV